MTFQVTKEYEAVFIDKWSDDSVFFLTFGIREVGQERIKRNVNFQVPVDGSGPVINCTTGAVAYETPPQALLDAYAEYQTQFGAFVAQILADEKCNPA